MAPAKFDDLGKAGNDLFSKGFDFGKVKFESKSKAEGVDFTLKGDHNNSTSAVAASLESNFNCHGVSIKKTWHTSNKCDLEFSKSGLAANLGKTTLTGAFSPDGGFVPGKFKQAFSNDKANVNFASTLSAAPKLNLDAVFNHNNINAGFSVGYDVGSGAVSSKALAFNLVNGSIDSTIKSCLNNDVALTVFNKVDNNKSIGVQANYGKAVDLAFAVKCTGCPGVTSQYKLNQKGHLGLSYACKLDACDLTVSSHLDLLNLNAGGHKVGANLKFNF